ncbi:TetR/AcrR family transcriptional regulator [Actinoallomurus rhizosphaericola]|uniref:TetR/AcrR family transcriptional regulator n=1 Tax=Actinoallomurus rhizosphaericola TaxID=2952536 RepID=UPI0020917462|nr:TetR/AcrR family transcriptional regulator [Actinoallomurus rhizosphaericola]MCO5993156.1 TetR/AcrR family transcriptional regulator [Actinoallomurus rhizosphaericola]
MNASRTARERARSELTREIKEAARRRLSVSGAQGLSLRAVARELGMVSSALYRYFASRDELLTALIIDAYDALATEIEAADRAALSTDFRGRWEAACRATRAWASAHPHEYALVYGSPVPGYHAPETTIAPGARVPMALLSIVRDAHEAGALSTSEEEPPLPPALADQAAHIAGLLDSAIPNGVIIRGATAWTQLFGMITFELFGQYANSLDPADAFFDYSIDRLADLIGLPETE